MRARLIAIAFLLGCGGSGVDINTNQDNVCGQVAEVACHNLYQCCSEGEIERFLNVSDPRTENECRDDVTRLCARSIASLDYGIDQKHVRFDGKLMDDCLNSIVAPDGSCTTIASALPWTEACMNSAWTGLVEDGGTCLSTTECASKDSLCGANQTCTPRPGDGQACGVAGCKTGLFCSVGTCRPQLATGGACTSSPQCLEGLFCDFAATPVACAPLKAPGEACTSNAGCTSSQCNPGTCAITGQTCFTDSNCGKRCADDNSTCFADSDCALGTCSVSNAACISTAACGATGGTCVFPVRCNQVDCVGDAACGEKHVVVDYCQAAINDLPVP